MRREPDSSTRRALGLLALLELGDELTTQRDPSGIAGAALFNLMGQYGCSRGAVWVFPECEGPDALLLRAQGIPEMLARDLGERCARWFRGPGATAQDAVVIDRVEQLDPPPPGLDLARQGEIAVLAPLTALGRTIGIFALGPRVGGGDFGRMELEVLRTSLALLAGTMENVILRNREIELRRRLRAARAARTGGEAAAVRPTRGDLKSVLASLHEERRPGFVADLRELELSAAADAPPALFDPDAVTRVVDAMLDDAARRTPCGTRVRLRLEAGTDAAGAWVAVEVRDDGPGIPPEKLRVLFATPAPPAGELGLGDAKRLAEKMDGRLSADSEVGRGTVLTLRLPAT